MLMAISEEFYFIAMVPSLEYRGLTMLVMPTFVVGMEKAAIR